MQCLIDDTGLTITRS